MKARGTLGRKSLSLLASTWLANAVSLACGILIARRLGPDAVGSLSFSLGLSGLVLAALLPGFAQAHLKRLAEGDDPGACMGTFGAIKLVLFAPLVAIVLAAGPYRHVLFETETLEAVFLLLLAGRLCSSLADVFTLALIARELVAKQAALLLASRGLRLLSTLAVLAWTPDLTLIAATFTLEGVVELAGGFLAVRVWAGIRLRAPTRDRVRSYWRYARPMLVSVPIGMLQDSVDRVVVKQWAGLTAAGYYHVARGAWEILGSLSAYPAMFLFTRMSALFAVRSPARDAEARVLFYSGLDKLLFVATPLGILVWTLAGPLIAVVYGPAFAPAASPVKVFVLANLAATLFNHYTQVLYALDAHGRLVPIVLPRAALYLVVLAVLVPPQPLVPGLPALGLADSGAALARLFLLVFPAWMYVAWTRALAGVGFYRRSPVYVAGFTLGVALSEVVTRLLSAPALPPALVSAAATVLGLAAHALCLAALHPGARETFAYCAELLSPARFAVFLRREIGRS